MGRNELAIRSFAIIKTPASDDKAPSDAIALYREGKAGSEITVMSIGSFAAVHSLWCIPFQAMACKTGVLLHAQSGSLQFFTAVVDSTSVVYRGWHSVAIKKDPISGRVLQAEVADGWIGSAEKETNSNFGISEAEYLASLDPDELRKEDRLQLIADYLNRCFGSIGMNGEATRRLLMLLRTFMDNVRRESMVSKAYPMPKQAIEFAESISLLSYKWTTFQLLYGRKTSQVDENTEGSTELRDSWIRFRETDPVMMLEHFMKQGAIRAAGIIWSRHVDKTMVKSICRLLGLLPPSLPVHVYEKWLQEQVFPQVVKSMENGTSQEIEDLLKDLTDWALTNARRYGDSGNLEAAMRTASLPKAIRRVIEMSETYEDADDSFGTSLRSQGGQFWINCDNDTSLQKTPAQHLNDLEQQLRHIQYLATAHQFDISLKLLVEETPATIAMSMLDRATSSDTMAVELEQHVIPYLGHCGVPAEAVLEDYVVDLLDSSKELSSVEEGVLLCIIDRITDEERKAHCALTLLQSSHPPYSATIKTFASACTEWKTTRHEQLEEHVRLMGIQDMLLPYGIKNFNISDRKNARKLLSHLVAQISRPSAIVDAMRLVDAYSHLKCDQAATQYLENLVSFPSASPDVILEAKNRAKLALVALSEVEKRYPGAHDADRLLLVMEHAVNFGLSLIERDEASADNATALDNAYKSPDHFTVLITQELTQEFLKKMEDLEGRAGNFSAVVIEPQLLVDLQRMQRVYKEWGILLSVNTLRDPNACEEKLRGLMDASKLFPDLMIGNQPPHRTNKGKKRAAPTSSVHDYPQKRYQDGSAVARSKLTSEKQDESAVEYGAQLGMFARALGLTPTVHRATLAQFAAQHGAILHAVHYARDLFSRRKVSSAFGKQAIGMELKATSARTLTKISVMISGFTAAHVDEVYELAQVRHQALTPAQLARLQAPTYSLELLKYSICVCDDQSFEETLLLLKNAVLLHDVLQLTQLEVPSSRTETDAAPWKLYERWFRKDSCVLPCAQVMRLATRFAIAEHTNLVKENAQLTGVGPSQDIDWIPSRRLVSFLVENQADLLSLQVLLSMRVIPDEATGVISSQMKKLLSTVFQSRHIDNHLALGLMLSMENVDAFDGFRRQISRENVAKDFNRFQQLAYIGSDAARAWQQIAFLHQCVELEGNARWLHYLSVLEIPCDHKKFTSERRDLSYIRSLIPLLLSKSNFDFYTVVEFARHYQVDDSYPAILYVEALLLKPELSNKSEYQDCIAGVREDIHEPHLIALLLKCIPQIKGSDYDRLMFVFKMLKHIPSYTEKDEVDRRLEVLEVLTNLITTPAVLPAKIKENTHQEQSRQNPNRICFHQLMENPRTVVGEVLQENNFAQLLALCAPLQMDPDELHLLLIKNLVKALHESEASAEMCSPRTTKPAPFERFSAVFDGILGIENRVTAAEWLAENLRSSEEKLKALEYGLHVAQSALKVEATVAISKGGKSAPSFVKDAVKRIEAKALRLRIQLVLESAGVQEEHLVRKLRGIGDQLLQLISKPKELFFELHQQFALDSYEGSSETLNKIADSVADLLRIPAQKCRMDVIKHWLLQNVVFTTRQHSVTSWSESSAEETSVFDEIEEEQRDRTDRDFVKRILYVLIKLHRDDAHAAFEVIGSLISLVKETKPKPGVTSRAKLRALRVIQHVAQYCHNIIQDYVQEQAACEETKLFFREIKSTMLSCKYMVVFEEHRVPIELSIFKKNDKEALVRGLLREHGAREAWVLRCAAQVMLDFGVDTLDLWDRVLSSMKTLGMSRSLFNTLDSLTNRSFLRGLDRGSVIWEEVLLSPLLQLLEKQRKTRAVSSTTTTANDTVIQFAGIRATVINTVLDRMVTMLQRCPFLDQIDVPSFVVHLRDLTTFIESDANSPRMLEAIKIHSFAVRCAMVIPKPSTRMEALTRIIQAGAYSAVLDELVEMVAFYAQEDNVEQIETEFAEQFTLVQACFEEAVSRDQHEHVLHTSFETAFLEFVAATGKIDRVLAILLKEKRLELASNVIELFYDVQSMTPPQDPATASSKWSALETYVASSTSADLEPFRQQL
ncbi:TPA: hypothetical protein N0F65_007558 [Lagenidium giganteum]|uniref:RZZ complex subunit KNTC1/ROD C-terminal domain-containing protein n=1 Tax=Lagenidium giganteum TaxID=4803 RepID=A0AAV2ZD17_9STRA|nr:TPA: hypothetical protein N0F65_007558 [Lagenidium giganteum]